MDATALDATPHEDRRTSRWDVQHGFRNYISVVGAQALSAALAFVAIWLATHFTGATGYGKVAALFAASQCVAQLTVNWTALALTRFGCAEYVDTGSLAASFWNRLFMLAATLGVVLCLAPAWLTPLDRSLHIPANLRWLLLANVAVFSGWIHLQYSLQAAKLPRVQGALIALERGCTVCSLVALAATGRITVYGVAASYIVAPLLPAAIAVWRLRRLIVPLHGPDRATIAGIARFSVPLIPATVAGYLSTNYLDAIFISHYRTAADLGVYAVAYQAAGMAMQFPQLVGTLLLPYFVTVTATGNSGRITGFLRDTLPVLTLAWAVTCALAAMVGSALLPVVFGARFASAGQLLWPLFMAGALAGPVLMGYGVASVAKSATYVGAATAITCGASNLLLDFILVPRFGVSGCAWGSAGAYACAVAVAWVLMGRVAPGSRSWNLVALAPIGVGSVLVAQTGSPAVAAGSLMAGSVLLLFLYRKQVKAGVLSFAGINGADRLLRSSSALVTVLRQSGGAICGR